MSRNRAGWADLCTQDGRTDQTASEIGYIATTGSGCIRSYWWGWARYLRMKPGRRTFLSGAGFQVFPSAQEAAKRSSTVWEVRPIGKPTDVSAWVNKPTFPYYRVVETVRHVVSDTEWPTVRDAAAINTELGEPSSETQLVIRSGLPWRTQELRRLRRVKYLLLLTGTLVSLGFWGLTAPQLRSPVGADWNDRATWVPMALWWLTTLVLIPTLLCRRRAALLVAQPDDLQAIKTDFLARFGLCTTVLTGLLAISYLPATSWEQALTWWWWPAIPMTAAFTVAAGALWTEERFGYPVPTKLLIGRGRWECDPALTN